MQKLIILSLAILIILSSCKLKDDTSTSTTNPVEPGTGVVTIKVVLPNGGESLSEGSSYQIQWTGTGSTLVRIQYSFDNGSSWGLVVDSLKNTGVYGWFPIPNTISNQCRIRISTIDGVSSDESDKVFSIVRSSNESLRIISPVGNETWEAGSAQQIKWNSSGLDSVKIDYTTDNGQHWNLIGVDKKNTGIYYWEPVPNTPSTLAKVRIMDAKDGVPSTESTNTFTILPEPKISVLAPTNNEIFLAGSNQNISWISENVENVKISYTTDNGFKWYPIVESTPSIGFYVWKNIPNHNSTLCKVRVEDALDGQPFAFSGLFTITNQLTKSISIVRPVGGEEWQAGTTENITWISIGISNVKIEFTSNNGLTWNEIQNSFPNTGSYSWNIPNISSTQCKIKISDVSDNTIKTESKNPFTINPIQSITLIAPNGNENIIAGESYNILWNSTGIKNVKIEFTANNGILESDWHTIVGSTPAAQGSYSTSFTIASNQYRIRISDTEDGSPWVLSASTFTVGFKPSISVVTPNGGENWLIGQPYEIRWQSNNISFVKIELTINGGAEWKPIDSNVLKVSNGLYNWVVDGSLIAYRSDLCKIRISEYDSTDPNKSRASDESDNFFSIHPKTKLLRLLTPNGGESWAYNSYASIEWTSAGISFVKLEYTLDNGMNWYTISEKYPSTGAYDWNPPNISSSLTRIRITDVSDDAGLNPLSDVSDSYFNLSPTAVFINIVKPDDKSILTVGQAYKIIWNNSDEITSVDLEYSLDNGLTWLVIGSQQTPEKFQHEYNWIPLATSNFARIRISGAGVVTISSVFKTQL